MTTKQHENQKCYSRLAKQKYQCLLQLIYRRLLKSDIMAHIVVKVLTYFLLLYKSFRGSMLSYPYYVWVT